MTLITGSITTREQKMAFIERSFNPLDSRLNKYTRGLEQVDDAYFDEIYHSYLESSIRCREALNHMFSEKPHLKMMVDRLSDDKINRLFSSMKVIGKLGRVERMTIIIGIIATLILIYGFYASLLTATFAALGIGFMDVLLVRRLNKKIDYILSDHLLVEIITSGSIKLD
ncbi:hypothetical protein [Pedobacter sp. L105]|uniref:hypothetical protein n=1 Tax=Pedobacter sp. L105 TaxID=1641871 RepID=UPI00131B35F9|nr:hypothetical protein [Pedobacter sp. L105]